ncbi:hypothetical protein [Methylobacterium durans]|uniref:Uncharacterized protein n=1 Tax=Methylobacterium durans TaxID=2202825 RepID=A0A2U8W242_9HYPH|nr:hypothetical protein [Methylobacterium durans]AWN39701.1 hypothetical protein DK389_03060 [Methylobacterium durans]
MSSRGNRFASDVRIQIVALNDKGQVIGLAGTSVSQNDSGYEAFAEMSELQGWPSRIRIVVSCR